MRLFDTTVFEDDDQQKRRQQLINFGHSQWGFNNWSWAVTKQDLDFVEFSNGKYVAGVVAFVSINVKSFDIHRENIGYSTATAVMKGSTIFQARKGAVTNALRETLLSFGGSVATELMELLGTNKQEVNNAATSAVPETLPENNQNLANKPINEVKNAKPIRKDSVEIAPASPVNKVRSSHPNINPAVPKVVVAVPPPPPVAKALPMPANLPPAANKPFPPAAANQRVPPPAPHPRPNSNAPAEPATPCLEGMTDEEARAERKRRQRLAQEQFQRKLKQKAETDGGGVDKLELQKSSFDNLLLDIPSQDIIIEETNPEDCDRKRKSPEPSGNLSKRRGSLISKLDIVTDS